MINIVRREIEVSMRINCKIIGMLKFADDIAIITDKENTYRIS